MPTIKVDAHELSKVKVEFISLVHRPANRLPIRIMKGDNAMLDLDSFNRKTDATRARKSEAVNKASQAISDATLLLVQAGYKVIAAAGSEDDTANDGEDGPDGHLDDSGVKPIGSVKNTTGVTTNTGTTNEDDGSPNAFSGDTSSLSIATTGKMKNTSGVSDGGTPGDGLNPDVSYSTSPVKKAGDMPGVDPFPGKPKAKKMKQPAGIPPGAGAIDAHAQPETGQVVDEDLPNAMGMGAVPVAKAVNPVSGVGDDNDDDDNDENPATMDDDQETGGGGGDGANDEAVTKPSVAKSKTKKADDNTTQILAALTAMNANFQALSTTVQKMDGVLGTLGTEVAAVSARVQKTDKSLAALVPGQARDDHVERAIKSDTKVLPPIDTAYNFRL